MVNFSLEVTLNEDDLKCLKNEYSNQIKHFEYDGFF